MFRVIFPFQRLPLVYLLTPVMLGIIMLIGGCGGATQGATNNCFANCPQTIIQDPPNPRDTTGGNAGSGVTQPPSGNGSTSPISEGDFLDSPGPITGPAIVEFWNGQGGANIVCGTFQLSSGESFSYRPAGHWWKYKSDQDMQAEWPLHLKLFNQKPANAPCTRGQRPPQ